MIAANAAKKLIHTIKHFLWGKASREELRFLEAYYNSFDQQKDDPETLDLPEKEALAREMKAVILQHTGPVTEGTHSHDTFRGVDKATCTLMVI